MTRFLIKCPQCEKPNLSNGQVDQKCSFCEENLHINVALPTVTVDLAKLKTRADRLNYFYEIMGLKHLKRSEKIDVYLDKETPFFSKLKINKSKK
jgi:hypothetical protein